MNAKGRYLIVAETAPIIKEGLATCLRKLKDPDYQVLEASTPDALHRLASQYPEAVVIVSPVFGGSFDPAALRREIAPSLKIVAIETAPLPRTARALYDTTIPISDDLDTIARRLADLYTPAAPQSEEKDTLSTREQEIVTLVVKGLTNKEIASRLFLSVHTVHTHRRNIARKLEIHSATGLTIYAIVNGLVDLSEIKI